MVFNTYHHTRTCLDEKIEIDEKNFKKKISKKKFQKISKRSYDFLTKSREKNPMWRNRTDLAVTLECAMNSEYI